MKLDDRKKKILTSVVENYIKSAEPTSSKQIEEEYDNKISSATIRNEMKALEELGFLEQPHISSGRVPSTKGYRFYVDNLMTDDTLSMVDIDYINNNIVSYGSAEKTLEIAAEVVSKLLNLPTVLNVKNEDVIEEIKILKISEQILLIILMAKNGTVKDVVVKLTDSLPKTRIEELAMLLNKNLKGTPLENLQDVLNKVVHKELSKFSNVLEEMSKLMVKELSDSNKVKGDIGTLLALPEFSDTTEIKKYLDVVSTRNIINEVIEKINEDDISIVIGSESGDILLKDYTLLSLGIENETSSASIKVLSPKRVDYKRAISTLKLVNNRLKNIFNKGGELKK